LALHCKGLSIINDCASDRSRTVCCQCKASTVKRRRSEAHVPSPRSSSSVERCTVACGSVAASCATTDSSDVSPTSWNTWTSSAPVDERAVSASRMRGSIAPIRARRTSRRTYSSATTAWQVRFKSNRIESVCYQHENNMKKPVYRSRCDKSALAAT